MAQDKKNKRIQSILGYLQNDVPDATPVDEPGLPDDSEELDEEDEIGISTPSTPVTGSASKKKKRPPTYV